MQTVRSGFDEDMGGLVRGVAADLQTSIALNRILVRTLSTLSADCGVAAETALEDEVDQAQRGQASPRTLEALQRLQSLLNTSLEDEKMARRLEQTLISAAEQLRVVDQGWVSALRNEAGPHAAKAG